MKKLMYFISFVVLTTLFACNNSNTANNSETDSVSINQNDNPFMMDSVHYNDFYKQAVISDYVKFNDSTYWSIACVRDFLDDSLATGKDGQNTLYLNAIRANFNGQQDVSFKLSHYNRSKGDTISSPVGYNRFYQLLSSLKFIREKIKHRPMKDTELWFNENGLVEVHAQSYSPDTTWTVWLTLRSAKNSEPHRDIRLSTERLDSLISKMDAMRDYFINY